ncbi:uroporphyrinogen-III synthase [Alteribacillus iranensis]|uniref:Uroporphyrinogen-III synthase n=1 Tax=Alteribacillus iranensis TaxID=930128 RepID=A0A1I2CNG6_9BACI|nr:uroporphyrinogen-III synthase [Alteribacillus iranensis]SFE69846.1 uroporphyrinogen-III synthase [Alteribacillus iranensis]
MIEKPLAGRSILVTRSSRQAPSFVRLIEEEGGSAETIPLIKTVPLPSQWDNQVRRLQESLRYDWIVFTSVNTVAFFKKALKESGSSFPSGAKIAAIGEKTMLALEEEGWEPEVVPKQYVAEDLASVLKTKVKAGDKVLFPKSELARDVIPAILRESGAAIDEMPLYTSTAFEENKEKLQRVIASQKIDIFTFTSPSIVRTFTTFVNEALPPSSWNEKPAVCIGPVTEKEAADQGFKHRYMSSPYTMEGMMNVLMTHFGNGKKRK